MNHTNLTHLFAATLVTGLVTLGTALSATPVAPAKPQPEPKYLVPIGGNSWLSPHGKSGEIAAEGLVRWSDAETVCRTWVRINQPGDLNVFLDLKTVAGESKIKITVAGQEKTIVANGLELKTYAAGSFQISQCGYVAIEIQGLSKTGAVFGLPVSIGLGGAATALPPNFVVNNDGGYFHWGRRGPSVHLNYVIPKDTDLEWFYNEITIPAKSDVIGSYFMAAGFSVGYFGIQVNSATNRQVLFSVWSPFTTDDPAKIPPEKKIILENKGKDVNIGEFGNEGSGGQSRLQFAWQAGTTYKFLLQARPLANNHTIFRAYFFAPETNQWQLIASFNRPETNTYLKHLHSFLENFNPATGDITRAAFYNNQWVCDSKGNWLEINTAKLTADNTARKKYRMDYSGGGKNGMFFLKNCGFFNDFPEIDQRFVRANTNKQPDVNLKTLPGQPAL